MRSTSPDHHHHSEAAQLDPREELIALAKFKGKILSRFALQQIEDELARRNIPLRRFVREIRPHFKNNIRNPAGFMIDFAKRFESMAEPAVAQTPNAVACAIPEDRQELLFPMRDPLDFLD